MFDRVKPYFYGVTRGSFIFCALSFMAALSCSGATLQPVVVTKQVQMRPRDKYGRRVEVHDPGNLGAVLVTSNDLDLPVDKVMEELGIEPWDDYYRRSSDARDKALEK